MIDNCINKELSFIERKVLFSQKNKELLQNVKELKLFEFSLLAHKTIIFNKFDDVIPIITAEIYKEQNVNDVVDGITDIAKCAFYVKHKEKEAFLIFEKNENKISIECTDGIICNYRDYDGVHFLKALNPIINNFVDSIQYQIDRNSVLNSILDNNIKLLTDMIE